MAPQPPKSGTLADTQARAIAGSAFAHHPWSAPPLPAPTTWQAEISRKVLHVATAIIPTVYLFTERTTMLALLSTCTVVAVVVEILRQVQPHFAVLFKRSVGFMVRSSEWRRVCGATYVFLGALLAVLLFPQKVAVAGLLILSISDTAAALIGLRFGRAPFLGKTLSGSLAFLVTAYGILVLTLPDPRGRLLLLAMAVTLVEAVPALKLGQFELNDNLTIPLLTGVGVLISRLI
jgi:dolichol kinase